MLAFNITVTISGIAVWHKIFMESFFVCEFHGVFVNLQKLNPLRTNCLPEKNPMKILLLLFNLSESGEDSADAHGFYKAI